MSVGMSREPIPRRTLLRGLYGLLLATALRGRARAAVHVELAVGTDGDLLAFKPTRLTCPSGAHVHLTFSNEGKYITQDHDWVLVKPGTAQAVADAGLKAGEKNGWVPRGDPRVLAATPPCGKGQHVSVDFIAPAPGRYPVICTNPGHAAVMHGVLIVVPG